LNVVTIKRCPPLAAVEYLSIIHQVICQLFYT